MSTKIIWVSVANSRVKLREARLVSGSKSEIITAVQINTPTRAESSSSQKILLCFPTALIISRRGNLQRFNKDESCLRVSAKTRKNDFQFLELYQSSHWHLSGPNIINSIDGLCTCMKGRKLSRWGPTCRGGKSARTHNKFMNKIFNNFLRTQKTNKSPADNVLFSPLTATASRHTQIQ